MATGPWLGKSLTNPFSRGLPQRSSERLILSLLPVIPPLSAITRDLAAMVPVSLALYFLLISQHGKSEVHLLEDTHASWSGSEMTPCGFSCTCWHLFCRRQAGLPCSNSRNGGCTQFSTPFLAPSSKHLPATVSYPSDFSRQGSKPLDHHPTGDTY